MIQCPPDDGRRRNREDAARQETRTRIVIGQSGAFVFRVTRGDGAQWIEKCGVAADISVEAAVLAWCWLRFSKPAASRRSPIKGPWPVMPVVTYSEVARRLRLVMRDRGMSADELSDLAGWDLAEYLDTPDQLADLPIFGLRRISGVAGVDWAAVLATAATPAR